MVMKYLNKFDLINCFMGENTFTFKICRYKTSKEIFLPIFPLCFGSWLSLEIKLSITIEVKTEMYQSDLGIGTYLYLIPTYTILFGEIVK